MNKLVIVLVLLMAGTAVAGPIFDVQTGAYTVGDEVTISGAVVTGVRYNGCFISEDPTGPYTGVWVYVGSGNLDPMITAGTVVDVKGLYEEYYDFTEINVTTDATGYCTYMGDFGGTLVPTSVTVAQLNADPEAFEGCFIAVLGLMIVTDNDLGYGEWEAEVMDDPGQFIYFDDYWYDPVDVMIGDCFCCAVGVVYYSFGVYKLEPFDGSICFMGCPVANEELTFGDVKALYR
ncbi:hypothetical protein H8E07_15795 [bacterium]|nr:hypothetical protein [bacterium]